MFRIHIILLIVLITISNTFYGNDNKKKKDGEQQGLITTMSYGDPAPLGRYFSIVSAMASDSTSNVVYPDSIPKSFLLSSAFLVPNTEQVFRFDKDPYELYYKIIFGKAHQSCVDVIYDYFEHFQHLEVNTINYGNGQNFYLKYHGNGRYKIYHSSGKIVAVNLNRSEREDSVVLIDDCDSLETLWLFIDPNSFEIYKPL